MTSRNRLMRYLISCFTGEADLSPVSLFVSAGHVAMVTEDLRYVLEELEGDRAQPIKPKSTSQTRKQFEVKDLQKLTDIVTIVGY